MNRIVGVMDSIATASFADAARYTLFQIPRVKKGLPACLTVSV